MIPLKDDNPRVLIPFFNYGLILCNVAVFIYQFSHPDPDLFVHAYGAIPAEIMSGQNWSSLITGMFLHGGWLHLLGNMLYLWIFGDNVEGLMGHGRYLIFYLLCGLVATMAHIAVDPTSEIPMVGASGAISGVLGAYVVKFPRARILILVPIVICLTTFRIPALFVLGFWFVKEVISGVVTIKREVGSQVAFFAHVGGFVAGLLFVKFFERRQNLELFRRRDSDDYPKWG
ncbi:MAG: rhomboid family intramembrane serine protease [candidate division KSB1 bacterium]|nr:rhomboid family intramembrane serine protease [candidate division KSB1 bacterium]MDZ7368595.1 rhomboid family intramembrane serine protease [candidate division KSB1 bacterium]MDZ7406368.1 rhomboid family intramembrane serine protease [candidate division KSB1 bacterium]